MRYLLADVYRLVHLKIMNRRIAAFISVLFISLMSLIILRTLLVLMADMEPAAIQKIALSNTYSIILLPLLFILIYLRMPSQHMIVKEKARAIRYGMIAVYTGCAIFCLLYLKFEVYFK